MAHFLKGLLGYRYHVSSFLLPFLYSIGAMSTARRSTRRLFSHCSYHTSAVFLPFLHPALLLSGRPNGLASGEKEHIGWLSGLRLQTVPIRRESSSLRHFPGAYRCRRSTRSTVFRQPLLTNRVALQEGAPVIQRDRTSFFPVVLILS